MNASISERHLNPALGATVLRVALGSMWIAHAMLKYSVFTIAGFAGWLEAQGLPGFMAWPVFIMELFGGLAILLGFHGRWASLGLLPIMLVAASTHLANGWVHTSPGGGWEYPIFLCAASIAHFFAGDGELALGRKFPLKIS
ncbi:MAG: DoxX family protein [Pseudomonadota bacterium]